MRQQQGLDCVRNCVPPKNGRASRAGRAYRLVAHFRWDDLIFTHLSARVPGREHHFLVNPYGLTFDEITASSLVKVDLDGTKVMDLPDQINPAGFTIHNAIPRRTRRRKMRVACAQRQRHSRIGPAGWRNADLAAVHLRARVARIPRL